MKPLLFLLMVGCAFGQSTGRASQCPGTDPSCSSTYSAASQCADTNLNPVPCQPVKPAPKKPAGQKPAKKALGIRTDQDPHELSPAIQIGTLSSGVLSMMPPDYEIDPEMKCPKNYQLTPAFAFDVRDRVWKCRKVQP